MKTLVALFLAAVFAGALAQSQSDDHLSPAEISAAVSAKPNTGFIELPDMGALLTSMCKAQYPNELLYTPEGWINALSISDKKQYLPFNPTPDDTLRALTVISHGCATGTPAGPACDSITRVALLSDKGGAVVVESLSSKSVSATWQNGFGATAACTSLVSKFSMADVQKVRNAKGEFLIVTFNGSTLLKTYNVKERFIKKLGM
jgi:hypothetical protein